jgi:hypothetical protein
LGDANGTPQIDWGAAWAGGAEGSATGAGIGTAILPGIGTVIGSGLGALVGGVTHGLSFSGGSSNVYEVGCCDTPPGSVCGKTLVSYGNEVGFFDAERKLTDADPIPVCISAQLLPGFSTPDGTPTIVLPSLDFLLTIPQTDLTKTHVPHEAFAAASVAATILPYNSGAYDNGPWPDWHAQSEFPTGSFQTAVLNYWLGAYEQLIMLGLATGERSQEEVLTGAPYPYPYPYALGTEMADGTINSTPAPNGTITSTYKVPLRVGPYLPLSDAVTPAGSSPGSGSGSPVLITPAQIDAMRAQQQANAQTQGSVRAAAAPESHLLRNTCVAVLIAGAGWAGYRTWRREPIVPPVVAKKVKALVAKAKRHV